MRDTQTGEMNGVMLHQYCVHAGGVDIFHLSNTKTGPNNVTVTASPSCVSVTEAPANVHDNKNMKSETIPNKQK